MAMFDIVLDLIEHPERYSQERIDEILSDPENKEIYNLLCKTKSAYSVSDEINDAEIENQWREFSKKHFIHRFGILRFGSRAASIGVFILTSLVAVAIGVTVTVNVFKKKTQDFNDEAQPVMAKVEIPNDTLTTDAETVPTVVELVLFENETLENILETIEDVYSVNTIYKTSAAAKLHLYYRFDPTQPLSEIVEQLNTFEQINIRINGKDLIVD